jgi:hypothetical protein
MNTGIQLSFIESYDNSEPYVNSEQNNQNTECNSTSELDSEQIEINQSDSLTYLAV